jgi:hypothetical protein
MYVLYVTTDMANSYKVLCDIPFSISMAGPSIKVVLDPPKDPLSCNFSGHHGKRRHNSFKLFQRLSPASSLPITSSTSSIRSCILFFNCRATGYRLDNIWIQNKSYFESCQHSQNLYIKSPEKQNYTGVAFKAAK